MRFCLGFWLGGERWVWGLGLRVVECLVWGLRFVVWGFAFSYGFKGERVVGFRGFGFWVSGRRVLG